MLVDWSVLSTSNLPAITPEPPILIFLARPKPPSITAAPEVMLVDSVVSFTSNLPLISAAPPTFIFYSIPTPPSTINAPLSFDVL